MSEPYLPVPPPEDNSNWNPEPARCEVCGNIVDVRHHEGGAWEHEMGYCSTHGLVRTVYAGDSQPTENDEEEGEPDD